MARVSNVKIVRMSSTSRVLLASWQWTKDQTTGYHVRWWYKTSINKPILGQETNVPYDPRIQNGSNCQYTMPEDAVEVWVHIQPYTEVKDTTKETEQPIWTAEWSTQVTWKDVSNLPSTPPAPTTSLEYRIDSQKYELTVSVTNLNSSDCKTGSIVQWKFYRNDKLFHSSQGKIVNRSCGSSCWVDIGYSYKVVCRVCRPNARNSKVYDYSSWSDFSNAIVTPPTKPSKISKISAKTKTSVYLEWPVVKYAKSYDVEYTTKKEYFNNSEMTSTKTGITTNSYQITGLTSGETYYFRVRAVNDAGASPWTSEVSITIGTKPDAPTTWSSTTTAMVGDPLILYWVHNTVDGSSQTYAKIELDVNGTVSTIGPIKNTDDEDHKDDTSHYSIDTTAYPNGTVIKWKVKTCGITNEYGDWSTQRAIDIYAKPTLDISVENSNGNSIEELKKLPFYVSGTTSPSTQKPIGYHVAIYSNQDYQTFDSVGNIKYVKNGDAVYSNNFDTSNELMVEFSAHNLNLENNMSYTITCIAYMDSGLATDAISETVTVAWSDSNIDVDAAVIIDEDNLVAYIRPFCNRYVEHSNGVIETLEDTESNDSVLFSIYRREFDGSFTELSKNKSSNEYVVDIHPSLDYARYRIVATSKNTGEVVYYDAPNVAVNEDAAIIQWDEVANNFVVGEENTYEAPWVGSMLKLPYNLDVTEENNPDVELAEYIGRSSPVSYYGTQKGHKSSWKVEIPYNDSETLYMLRRLQSWMGDVYVREPSGSGYWANVNVSFSQTHCKLAIPVTISIVKVEGGA